MIRLPFVESGDIAEAVATGSAAVAEGGVLLMPTESFYGLGCDPRSEAGVARVFSLKDRPLELGLPVLCSDWQQLELMVVVPDAYRTKLSRLWPAALTVVLPTVANFPAAQKGTLAVRIPGHAELRALLYGVGPLTGTSANRHGDPPVTTVRAALASLVESPDVALDAGRTTGGEVSTLVDLSQGQPEVIRPGPCDWEEAYPDGF